MEQPPIGEAPRPIDIFRKIEEIHKDFFAKVPNYNRAVWSPEEAIQIKSGGCMAELLYVAGSLLYKKTVQESDLSIFFSVDHGKQTESSMIGGTTSNIKHVVLVLNVGGQQFECDFRANRADEAPRWQELAKDDEVFSDQAVEFFTLGEGLYEYAHRLGAPDESIPGVVDLISWHDPHRPTPGIDQIRFDEEF